jgi:hypothetical protein
LFLWNAAFVMILLAVAFSRVPQREWLSSAVAVFGITLTAIACQPHVEALLRGKDIGLVADGALLWFFFVTALAPKTIYSDLRNPPFPARKKPK